MLTSTSAIWSIGAAMASPYQTLYFVALGTAPRYVGILVAYGTAVTILALLIGGYIADNWGRRRVIIIFSWISVLSAFLFAIINMPILIIVPLTFGYLAECVHPSVQFSDDGFDRAKRQNQRILCFQRDKHYSFHVCPHCRRASHESLWHTEWHQDCISCERHFRSHRRDNKDDETGRDLLCKAERREVASAVHEEYRYSMELERPLVLEAS